MKLNYKIVKIDIETRSMLVEFFNELFMYGLNCPLPVVQGRVLTDKELDIFVSEFVPVHAIDEALIKKMGLDYSVVEKHLNEERSIEISDARLMSPVPTPVPLVESIEDNVI